MDWFDDIFDILNDDDDVNNEELENIMEEYNQDFDFDYIDTNVDEEEMMIIENEDDDDDHNLTNDDHYNEICEEQIMSQKLSQLSTIIIETDQPEKYSTSNKKRALSTPSTPDVTPKKIRESDNENNNNHQAEQIAGYLQATNEIFDEKMTCHIMNNATTITMEDLRQFANLRHQIGVVNLDQELWSFYLKLGTGQWKTQESDKIQLIVDRQCWPKQVKEMAVSSKSNTININKTTDEEKQKLFENFVHEYLHDLNKSSEQYQAEFNEKKNCCYSIGFTDEIEKAIETFVQEHGIQSLRMKLNYKIAILEYEYDAELLEREYLRHKPSNYQIETAKRLYALRYEHIRLKQAFIEFKQRILCNKPTKLMNSVSLSMSTTTSDTNPNETVRQHLTDQEEKAVEEKITNMMAKSIAKIEEKIYESQQLLDKEIDQISVDDNKNKNEESLTPNLVDLIYRRFNIIKKRLEYVCNFRINYLFRSRYGYLEDTLNTTNIGFSPTMIIDTPLHLFTTEQLKLLKRGPTYIPPCQMYVSSSPLSSCVSVNAMIEKQFKLLQHNLNIIFAKYEINSAQSMFVIKDIKDEFKKAFSISLPLAIQQRALYEKQLVESIREHLKANDLILRRTADQRNVFYLGYMKDFQEKINEFMNKTDTAFEISEIIDNNNLRQTHEYLTQRIKSMNSELDRILTNKKFYKDLLEILYINMGKIQLPYLYFLPDVSKRNNISVKPIIVSQYSATSRLARFLDGLLRPEIERYAQWTTFINGADFIRKLIRHIEEKYRLRTTTIFATINITNFNTLDSHANMILALEHFLNDHLAIPAIGNLPIKKITALTALFLHNNQFYYDNKIYRFTKGGPSSLAFTETLSHIYAYQWQKLLFKQPSLRNEFYGRCKNQIFFTWNETESELRQLLIKIACKNPNVQFETTIGKKVQFLNAQIENQNATFYSRVYHDPNVQKYTLPYVIGDSKLAHSHWLRSALIRAVRYCTSVHDFNQERLYLELTCLANGYSIEFIDRRINHFFTHFNATSLLRLRSTLDQQVYDKLRHQLFKFVSEQQKFYDTKQELEMKNQRVQLTYLYQYGSKRHFHEELKKILSPYLSAHVELSRNQKIKIILTTKQQYSLNALLSRQKPFHQLLNKENRIF